MFASLRGNRRQRPVPEAANPPAHPLATHNATQPNSISVISGNLVVGKPVSQDNGSRLAIHANSSSTSVVDAGSTTTGAAQPLQTADSKPKSYPMVLLYHEQSKYPEDQVMLHISSIPGLKEGDVCELKTYQHKAQSISDKKIYFVAKNLPQELRLRVGQNCVSAATGRLQTTLNLPPRSKVWIKKRDKELAKADLVELHVKDCFLNRGDMWSLSSQLVGSCVYLHRKLTFFDSLRVTVEGIYRDSKKVLSSYIAEDTRIVFRSDSARLIFLIQITDEMWNFEETGEQLFQKMVNSFFPKIFKKWKKIDTHHTITIILAASMDMSDTAFQDFKPGARCKTTTDYFRIVVDNISIIHWIEIINLLKKEFATISEDIKTFKDKDSSIHSYIKGRFVPVIKSNILEAVNFATTILTDPFRQVDLKHTTTHVMIVSAGSGLYDVDYDLLQLTGKKLLSLEMTMDLICLTRPPLHIVPLFRYIDYKNVLRYCIPTWLSIFFWSDSSITPLEWHPSCKIYTLQMMGLTANELVSEADITSLTANDETKSLKAFMANYDSNVFDNTKVMKDVHSSKESTIVNEYHQEEGIKDNEASSKPKRTASSSDFTWKLPTFADAVLDEVQKPTVIANMLTNAEISELSHDSVETASAASMPSIPNIPKRSSSLAVDSLRDLKKPSKLKEFITARIVKKLLPEQEINGKELSPSISKGSSNEISNVAEKYRTSTIANTPIIKKNLSKFVKNQDSSLTINNPPFENFSRPPSSPRRILSPDTLQTRGLERNREGYSSLQSNVTWIQIKNPSVPVSSDIAGIFSSVRWKDVYPHGVAKVYSKWRSFTTPAELPITVCDFPSKLDFEENFIFRNHSVTLNIDQEQYDQTAKELLINMIYIRLAAGFQVCVGDKVEDVELLRSKDKATSKVSKYINSKNWADSKVYLMLDSEIHRLSCGIDGVIDVQRYLRRNEQDFYKQVPSYTPLLKTSYEHKYRASAIDPLHVIRESWNWNQIDQVLAGYGDYVVNPKWKGFRSKYVLLPTDMPNNTYATVVNGRNEVLSLEELRLDGIRKLISLILKSKLKNKREEKTPPDVQPGIIFYTGSLFDFIRRRKQLLADSSNNSKDPIFASDEVKLSKDVELWKLAHSLQHSKNRLNLVNREWHRKNYNNCFIGAEFATWLIQNVEGIATRDEAVEYGQLLMDRNLFVHVLNKHGFLDGHYFYQLSPKFVIESQQLEKLSSDGIGELSVPRDNNPRELESPLVSSKEEGSENNTSEKKSTVTLSSSVTIDIDPSAKSYRRETCTVHYDKIHNPDHCFHIRLEWLSTTPKLIDDLIGNWSRLCEKYALKLIEVPWNELHTIPQINPFHSFIEVHLAINPWEDSEFMDRDMLQRHKFYYYTYLLKSFGFLLDNRATNIFQDSDTNFKIHYSWGRPKFKHAQYIHSSGFCIAEIRQDGSLCLAPNNVYISRTTQSNVAGKAKAVNNPTTDAVDLMLNFQKVCSNYESLRVIFLQAKEKWLEEKDKI